MNNISFVRYSPYASTPELTAQVAECYRQVFAEGPWHEWKQCSTCKEYWGVRDSRMIESWGFNHCGVPLVDFWSQEKVIEDLFHEVTANASCWLAMRGEAVVGFCWGYPIALCDLEDKLEVAFDPEFVNAVGRDQLVAYQDEAGVVSEYRNRKVAKTMIKHRLADFLKQGLQVGVVRTRQSPEPSETYLWYRRLGYRVVARYPHNDGRVIQARELGDLPEFME